MPWHDARNLSSAFFIYLDKNAEFIYTLTCLEISGLVEMPITGWTSGWPLVFLFSFKSNCTKNFNLQHRSKPLLRANKKHTTQIMRVCFFWSEWRDLNPWPHGPEPCALPSALHPDNTAVFAVLLYYIIFFEICNCFFTHTLSTMRLKPVLRNRSRVPERTKCGLRATLWSTRTTDTCRWTAGKARRSSQAARRRSFAPRTDNMRTPP